MTSEPPAAVRLVRDFVNSAEPQLGTDQLSATTAAECLVSLGLVEADELLTAEDLRLLVDLREGLRELLQGHAGHEVAVPALAGLDDVLSRVPLTVGLDGDRFSVSAIAGTVGHQTVAAILTAVLGARPEDWVRLKVCARDSCRWAFYDASRNRSGRWCSMAGCGNLVKMRRAYRTRSARAGPADAHRDSAQ